MDEWCRSVDALMDQNHKLAEVKDGTPVTTARYKKLVAILFA